MRPLGRGWTVQLGHPVSHTNSILDEDGKEMRNQITGLRYDWNHGQPTLWVQVIPAEFHIEGVDADDVVKTITGLDDIPADKVLVARQAEALNKMVVAYQAAIHLLTRDQRAELRGQLDVPSLFDPTTHGADAMRGEAQALDADDWCTCSGHQQNKREWLARQTVTTDEEG